MLVCCLGSERFLLLLWWPIFACPCIWPRLCDFLRNHFLIAVVLLGRALASSLLAAIVEVAHLTGLGMLVCSHYAAGVCLLMMRLLLARPHSFLSLLR